MDLYSLDKLCIVKSWKGNDPICIVEHQVKIITNYFLKSHGQEQREILEISSAN